MTSFLFTFALALFAPFAQAQGLPAWLDRKTIKVDVIDDAGRTQAPRREIKRGDRVVIRDFQGQGVPILEKLNRDVTEETVDVDNEQRWKARDEANDFDWIAGEDISLRHLKRMLTPKLVPLPKDDLSLRDTYKVPSAILLEVNDEKVQDYPPRHCPLSLVK